MRIATLLLLCLTLSLSAGWERTYGGIGNDAATSLVLGNDGGYVVAGYRTDGYWDVDTFFFGSDTLYDSTYVSETKPFAMKIDESGDSVWMRTYDVEYFYLYDILPKIVRVTGGGYALLFDDYEENFIRTDNHGNELWRSTVPFYYYGCTSTSDGGFIFTGRTSGHPYDMVLDKRDSLCNPEWTEEFGGSEDEEGYSVIQTSDGGYIIAGMTETWGSYHENTWIVRTDSLGVALWAKVFGEEGATSIIETDDGGFAFIEHFETLYRIDNSGDTIWTCGFYYSEDLYECIQSDDGGFVVVGGYYMGDVFLAKIDADGDTLWTRTFGGSGYDNGYSVRQTPDGGYIIAGETSSFGEGGYDIYVIKTDSLGYTSIEENPPAAKPEAFEISAYPNPFNSAVTIAIDAPTLETQNLASLQIEIYDVSGRRVADAEPVEAGAGRLARDTSTNSVSVFAPLTKGGQGGSYIWRPDQSLPSGIYLVRATIPGNKGLQPLVSTKHIVYLK